MEITFIRHLPTLWNKNNRLQGKKDINILPVTTSLQCSIEANQLYLKKNMPFDKVLASTLKRTQQTADIYGYRTQEESLLDELDFGIFEGQSKKQLLDYHGDKWRNCPSTLILGESMRGFERRIISFLQLYRECSNILVFGHGSWIRAFLSYYWYGHINHMNKITVDNNACITVSYFLRKDGRENPILGSFKA